MNYAQRALHNLWRRSAGLAELEIEIPSLDKLRVSEWDAEAGVYLKTRVSKEFLDLMKNRLIMGRFRYGPLGGTKPKWDKISRIWKELDLWCEDCKSERVLDIANMYFLLFVEEGRNYDYLNRIYKWYSILWKLSVSGYTNDFHNEEVR